MRYASGPTLNPSTRRAALARFVHRYTRDHVPRWAEVPLPSGELRPAHFASDEDWLAHTWFAVTKRGRLHEGVRACWSSPTWPDSPELRSRYQSHGPPFSYHEGKPADAQRA